MSKKSCGSSKDLQLFDGDFEDNDGCIQITVSEYV
jgi:hypothetical protein